MIERSTRNGSATNCPRTVLPIERSRLQFFAKAIGETDPVYTDVAAAARPATRTCPRRRPSCSRPSSSRRTRSACSRTCGIDLPSCCTASRRFTTTDRPAPATTLTVALPDQRHLRQEERRARVRRRRPPRHQPAGRRWWPSCAARLSSAATREGPVMTHRFDTVRSATNCRRCSFDPISPHDAGAVRRRLRRSQPDPHRHRRGAPRRHAATSSRRACWAWPGSAGCSPAGCRSRLRRFDARFEGITRAGHRHALQRDARRRASTASGVPIELRASTCPTAPSRSSARPSSPCLSPSTTTFQE